MGSVKTVATTAALPGTSLVTVPRVAKAEAAVDGTEAVAAGAVEEDAAVKVVAGTTLRRPPTAAKGKLRLPKEATTASIKEVTRVVGCIHGGSSLPPSNGACKRLVRELNAVASAPSKPLDWSSQIITFDPEDHPANTAGVGTLPLIVSPVIHNYKVTKMLVDGGSSLNLLTAKVLAVLQIPLSRLQDTGVFQGVNGSVTRPLGKITLPVTFGDSKNFRTEEIVFDIADTPLPYNGILGRPALAKFMAVSHFAYNMLKIPAPWGVIKVRADIDDAIYCVHQLNQTVATTADIPQGVQEDDDGALPGGEGHPGGSTSTPPKKAPFHGDPQLTKKVALTSDGVRSITIGARLTDK
jgi:hypothetical protein